MILFIQICRPPSNDNLYCESQSISIGFFSAGNDSDYRRRETEREIEIIVWKERTRFEVLQMRKNKRYHLNYSSTIKRVQCACMRACNRVCTVCWIHGPFTFTFHPFYAPFYRFSTCKYLLFKPNIRQKHSNKLSYASFIITSSCYR